MSFPRYLDYKDSGINWLGQVPTHWEIKRLKNVISLRKNLVGESKGSYTLLSLTLHGVIPRNMDNPKGKFPAEFDTYQVVEKDDLVFCLFDVEETPRAVGISPCKGMVTGAYTVGRVNGGVSASFFYNYHLSRDQYKAFKMYYTGLRNVIRTENFLDIPCPLPPLNEQLEISKFLDHQTNKVDLLIAEQQKLIEILKEKRQAVISHAVTKGLDSNVKLKNSGVEWLGDVPEHWVVHKIKSLTSRISSGKTPNGGSEVYVDDGVVFLRSQNVYDEGLRINEVVYIPEMVDQQMATSRVQSGDILLNITGGSIGRSCSVPKDFPNANVNQHVCVIRLVNPQLLPFVEIFFKSFAIKSQIDFVQNGAAREGLNFEQIGNMSLCLPPLSEQKQIVDQVMNEFGRYSSLISEAEMSVGLLLERRMALVFSAVTGQIDVRNLNAV
ncbi:MAG: restriction endonuclease subunit S [Burkholderiales bacterium]|jgi:type I restriction enzyme S subunit